MTGVRQDCPARAIYIYSVTNCNTWRLPCCQSLGALSTQYHLFCRFGNTFQIMMLIPAVFCSAAPMLVPILERVNVHEHPHSRKPAATCPFASCLFMTIFRDNRVYLWTYIVFYTRPTATDHSDYYLYFTAFCMKKHILLSEILHSSTHSVTLPARRPYI